MVRPAAVESSGRPTGISPFVTSREMKVPRVGTVRTDGTHMRANASKHKNLPYKRAGELGEQPEVDVKEPRGKKKRILSPTAC